MSREKGSVTMSSFYKYLYKAVEHVTQLMKHSRSRMEFGARGHKSVQKWHRLVRGTAEGSIVRLIGTDWCRSSVKRRKRVQIGAIRHRVGEWR